MAPSAPDLFRVDRLGSADRPSPLSVASPKSFVSDLKRILVDPHTETVRETLAGGGELASFEVAGPRDRIFFEPGSTRAAIATCGGLSPGINDVIRALVMQLWYRYGVRQILGAPFGYHGLGRQRSPGLRELTPELVRNVHERGGSMLGTSRGTPPTAEIVDTLAANEVQILFTVGGDGTMRGARAIHEEIRRRGLEIAVVGVPKTIDNDIPWVRRSFGFETAVVRASEAVRGAHTEAEAVRNGLGLVKLMGRHSGYIAASAVLATGHSNFCLVPEVPFSLEGENGLLALLEARLEVRHHALIVVAEGAGQEYFDASVGEDASGNRRLGDVGALLRERISAHFAGLRKQLRLKYINPSYLVRSAPANASDSLYCARLAQNAVHAAMAGKTGLLVGYWHGQMTHVPLKALEDRTQSINPDGELWLNVLESTGQPAKIGDPALVERG